MHLRVLTVSMKCKLGIPYISYLPGNSILYQSHLFFCICRLLSENEISAVNRAMFRGLNNLKSLSLYGNLISCVTPGAFDELGSLTSLNLISNPFNCNCHMAWFADWLRRKDLTASGPRCTKPEHLKNKAIHSLATHEFRCTSKLGTVL